MIFKCYSSKIEATELNKLIRKKQRNDLRKHKATTTQRVIEQGKSFKMAKRQLSRGRLQFTSVLEEDGTLTTDRERIVERSREFYEKLYSSTRSRGGGIATVYKSTLGSSITFKTCFDFTHTSFEVVQASITLQHNTLHFFCLYRPPPNRRNNLTDSLFTEQLPNLLDYVNSLPGHVCLVGDMNIHFDNPLQ